MLEPFTASTSNGHKLSIALEEKEVVYAEKNASDLAVFVLKGESNWKVLKTK